MPDEITIKPPRNEHELELRLVRLLDSDNQKMLAMRAMMANAIAGQFLPGGAILKGGSGLRLRYGSTCTRYTIDFDTTRRGDLDAFLEALRSSLEVGWNGFTGQIVILPQASPKGVPLEYVMQPVDVKLRYKGQPWCTVNVEISHDEAGASNVYDLLPPPKEVRKIFHLLGFPEPAPVAVMTLEHQMAQKIHAVSNPSDRNQRAHDLIDLQIIMKEGNVNLSKVHEICQRLFAYRRLHTWPTPVKMRDGWDAIYDAQRRDLNVLENVKDAIAWANELIASIDKA